MCDSLANILNILVISRSFFELRAVLKSRRRKTFGSGIATIVTLGT